MKKKIEDSKENGPLQLQGVIDAFNKRLDKQDVEGYSKKVKDNLLMAIEMREGCIDAFWDKNCPDKEEIKKEIIEFTKIIIRSNNIAQKHFNNIDMAPVDEQLEEALQTEESLKKIFHS